MNSQTAFVTGLVALGMLSLYVLYFLFGKRSSRKPALWKYQESITRAGKLIGAKQYDEADALLRPLMAEPDAPGHIYQQRAIIAERTGRLNDAMKLWKELSRVYPDVATGYTGQARLLIRQGQLEKAERLLAAARREVITPSDLTKVLAQAAQASERWEDAIRYWAQVRTEGPGDVDGYLQARICLQAVGREEEAAALLANIAMRVPANPLVRKALAEADDQGA